jgi:uncharacterized protein with GYD domain
MATFVTLVNFTDQGMLNIQESPTRMEAFKQLIEAQGGTVKSAYWTMGSYDLVVVVEASEDSMMVAGLKVGSLGNVRTQTLRGYSADEMKRLISKMP